MGESQFALEVQDVRYAYGDLRAVDGVSLAVRPGEVFGFLGPNGAGKTTTISMISGLLPPASGQVLVFGNEISARGGAARQRMGIVPQDLALYEDLTCEENVRFWGQVYGMRGEDLARGVREALTLVGLTERARDRARKLSGGLKRRLNLAAALVHSPDLLLLDEPTVGIDPQARLHILEVIRAQVKAGRAVLYTSHYLEEAEAICDRLAIIDHGRVLASGTLQEMHRLVGGGPIVQVRAELTAETAGALAGRCPGVSLLNAGEGGVSFSAADGAACHGLVRELFQGAHKFEDLRILEPNLQSLFLKLTGRELRD
jgi:ABC-2 type transport system ATP-binding protein